MPDNRIIGAALGQAESGADHDGVATTPRCASRPPTSAWRPPSTSPRRAGRDRAPGRLDHDRDRRTSVIDCLYAAGALDVDAVDGAADARARTSSPCCAPARSRRWRAASTTTSCCCRTPRPRRGACGPGPRSSASPSSCCSIPTIERRRPRRPGRHRQDAAGHRRRARAGRRAAPLRAPRRLPAARAGRAGPTSGSCPAASTRSSTRGWRRSTTPSSPSPTSAAAPTPAALIDELTARDQLSLESVTFLRGRSLQRQIVVVDEAQNLEPTTLKTILTRVGEGTKVIFTGDTSQIDAPYLGESNNALAVLIRGLRRPALLRPRHAHRLRAQRRRQPRRRAALELRRSLSGRSGSFDHDGSGPSVDAHGRCAPEARCAPGRGGSCRDRRHLVTLRPKGRAGHPRLDIENVA